MSNLAQLQGLAKERLKVNEEFMAKARELVKPALQDFLKENPVIKRVWWEQYTPYFNDGDACVFHLHGVHFSTEEDDEDGFEADWGDYEKQKKYIANEAVTEAVWTACKNLNDALNGMEDELEAVFGDHCRVIVTNAGVEVEEYSHD